jgi:hypothetical protein
VTPEQLATYLEVIKQFAEPTVQTVFATLVRSVYLRNLVWLVVAAIFQVIGMTSLVVLTKRYMATGGSYDAEVGKLFLVILGILVVVVMAMLLFSLPDIITNLAVPEARAIQLLLHGSE